MEPFDDLKAVAAARIADASAPGVSFEDHGEHALKGVSEPVRVFAVCLSTSSRLGE